MIIEKHAHKLLLWLFSELSKSSGATKVPIMSWIDKQVFQRSKVSEQKKYIYIDQNMWLYGVSLNLSHKLRETSLKSFIANDPIDQVYRENNECLLRVKWEEWMGRWIWGIF